MITNISLGFGQIIIVVILLFLLFGNVPNLFKDIGIGIKYIQQALSKDKDLK